jgi:hypothetical protein
MHRTIPVLLATLVATPVSLAARAQDRPPLAPTRDVSVTYRVSAEQAGQEMRMSWLVAEQRMRVDMPGGMGWSVVDQRSRKMFMVMDQQRMVMELPTQGGPGGVSIPTQPPDSARFTRGGTATVVGLSCTIWRYVDGASRGEACLTADGVMLRSSGMQDGHHGSVEATAVAYGPQDPARFHPPAGYQTMQLPGGMIPGRPPSR